MSYSRSADGVILIEAGGYDAGLAVPDRTGIRFYSGHFLFHGLDGQRFASVQHARIAALEIVASKKRRRRRAASVSASL